MNTVGSRLKLNRYPTVEAFFADLLLVYDNAIRYYQQEGKFRIDNIYEAAKVCLRVRVRACLVLHRLPRPSLYSFCQRAWNDILCGRTLDRSLADPIESCANTNAGCVSAMTGQAGQQSRLIGGSRGRDYAKHGTSPTAVQ